MDDDKKYQEFMEWLGKAPMTFPASEDTIALIKARYTPEDAELLTDVPFDPRTIGEIAEIKQMAVEDLKPRLDALAKKGVVWKINCATHSWSSIVPCTGAGVGIRSTTSWLLC